MDTVDYINHYPADLKRAEAAAEITIADLKTLIQLAETRRPIGDYSLQCPYCGVTYHASENNGGCPVCGR